MKDIKDLRESLAKAHDGASEENPNEEFFTSFAPSKVDGEKHTELTPETSVFQLGATGLQSSGGTVTEEWRPELLGAQGIKVYREMSDNDSIVGAILMAIQMLIRQVEWRATPAQVNDPLPGRTPEEAAAEEGEAEADEILGELGLEGLDETTDNTFGETGEAGEAETEEDENKNPFGKALPLADDEVDELDTGDTEGNDDVGALDGEPEDTQEFGDEENDAINGESSGEPRAFGDAEQNALFLKECMDDMEMSWAETISEVMSMLIYGWSFHEVVYKRRGGIGTDPKTKSKFNDNKLGWRKLPIRAQDTLERWEFDEESNDVVGMWQLPAPDYVLRYIPMNKALLFRTSVSKNNPEGKSILRNAYRSYVFKKRFEEVEGVGVERDLTGIPIAHVDPKILDPNATVAEKAILASIQDIVQNIRRDTQDGVIWPRKYDENGNLLYELTLMTSGGSRAFNVGEIIDRYDRRMAQSVLADFIMMGHETVGSFALSSSKTRLFAVALGAWLDMITGVFNDQAIPKLFELNGITENLPVLVHTDLEIPDLNELADFISKLAGVGIILDDDATEDHLRQIAKLPQRPLGETRLRNDIREAREQQTLTQAQQEPEDPALLRLEQYEREDDIRREDSELDEFLGFGNKKDKFPPRRGSSKKR